MVRLTVLLALLGLSCLSGCGTPGALQLEDGDRVVFLGDTFFEREGRFGVIETGLHRRWPDAHFTVRNLGRPADTVAGEAWEGYGPGEFRRSGWKRPETRHDPDYGFRKRLEQVKRENPTVVFLAYGSNAAFEGVEALPEFRRRYHELVNSLGKLGARVVVVTPPARSSLEGREPRVPGMDNRVLEKFVRALREIAKKRDLEIVDLFSAMPRFAPADAGGIIAPYTSNGLHVFEEGYVLALASFLEATGVENPLDRAFEVLDDPLREVVQRKNLWLTQRLRPQNATYVLYFRRHEMGHIAAELEQYDRYVEQEEERIASLKLERRLTPGGR